MYIYISPILHKIDYFIFSFLLSQEFKIFHNDKDLINLNILLTLLLSFIIFYYIRNVWWVAAVFSYFLYNLISNNLYLKKHLNKHSYFSITEENTYITVILLNCLIYFFLIF